MHAHCFRRSFLLPGLLLCTGDRGGRPLAAPADDSDSFAPARANAGLQFPLRTSGRYIVDASGQRVRFACVNWYGAQMEQMAPNGLNHQRVERIAAIIVGHGFNCVRLPFSLDVVFTNRSSVPSPHTSLRANPDLKSKSPLEVFDAALEALTDKGLMVILNNHVSSARWCCSLSDGEGLWYTSEYPVDSWLDGLAQMAARCG
ncbi:unnamed protein product [Prorocentrum cordatum]|uniref:Glycoside hydrolase family 5 domain-containing protein n=1 Tax=Prorocentrum cordatum TaxID=2364126 RepID=A0ABN9SDX5_9DINO|nr:unnamed protein product [Polarella glacialis]